MKMRQDAAKPQRARRPGGAGRRVSVLRGTRKSRNAIRRSKTQEAN